ncbi:MAG: hypothetical protein MJE77_28245 [Proteobacteria bacterium]|nr:hypothetical protein [Pseudomonadota bacterium]
MTGIDPDKVATSREVGSGIGTSASLDRANIAHPEHFAQGLLAQLPNALDELQAAFPVDLPPFVRADLPGQVGSAGQAAQQNDAGRAATSRLIGTLDTLNRRLDKAVGPASEPSNNKHRHPITGAGVQSDTATIIGRRPNGEWVLDIDGASYVYNPFVGQFLGSESSPTSARVTGDASSGQPRLVVTTPDGRRRELALVNRDATVKDAVGSEPASTQGHAQQAYVDGVALVESIVTEIASAPTDRREQE